MVGGIIGGVIAGRFLQGNPGLAQASGNALETRSRRFILVDEDNHQRALLRLIDGDATLLLSDLHMRWVIRIRTGDEGPFIHLSEGEINTRIGLGITAEGNTGLELVAQDGTPRVTLGLSAAGEASLTLNDGRGRPRTKMAVSPIGDASFIFMDENGNEFAHLPTGPRTDS